MHAMTVCLLLGFGFLPAPQAVAEDPPVAAAEAANDVTAEPEPKVAAAPADDAKPVAAAFVPPDGWRPKKRGKFTVYCRRQVPMGTRLSKEVCYDEEGIRMMLAAQADDRERTDQLRRICSSQATCGAN